MTGFFLHGIAFLCVFCLALATGSAFRMTLPFKKKHISARSVSICIFLTFCAIFYTILIFQTRALFPFPKFLSEYMQCGFSRLSYFILTGSIFFLGVILSLFWKIALPIFLILYGGFSYFTFYLLKSHFGNQDKKISLKIDTDSIFVNKMQVQKSEDRYQFLSFDYCTLPDSLFIPIPRHWFSIKSITEYKNPAVLPEPENEIPIPNEQKLPHILERRLISSYMNSVLLKKTFFSHPVPLPDEKIYPSIFSLTIDFADGSLNAHFSRDL